ncbi:scuwaprin-a-like [Alligator sinensis]|uniref:Scuwaprin-a-like n=1 Tax=Alligator sinensis TaxID=38654 RepID=A0A1U7S3I7_ALLSI|nr:scuwaprin-a-like [Alligator sinensis]
MKSGGLLLLAGLLVLCAQLQPASGMARWGKPGRCPPLSPFVPGKCLHGCNTDYDCRGARKCCSNGCGNECMLPLKGSGLHLSPSLEPARDSTATSRLS